MPPTSAVPVYFDLPRMTALCVDVSDAPRSMAPWEGWADFCRWATAQSEGCGYGAERSWRDALVSFVRWHGARDSHLIDSLRDRQHGHRSLRSAWLSSLGHGGGLFAGWMQLRAVDASLLIFRDGQARQRHARILVDEESRSFSAVLEEPKLLSDQRSALARLDALTSAEPVESLLVARVDPTRTLTPLLVAFSCS